MSLKPENENERLLSCPFCGPGMSQVDVCFDDVSKRFRVWCGRCGSSSGTSVHANGSKESAIARWNTRPALAQGQPIDHVREALEFYADPRRYDGANQRIKGDPDGWQPFEVPYLWDVTRDGGHIAREALRTVTPHSFQCMGRKQSLPEPGECNWPDCGCDPHATKVIEALLEQGWTGPLPPQDASPLQRAIDAGEWPPPDQGQQSEGSCVKCGHVGLGHYQNCPYLHQGPAPAQPHILVPVSPQDSSPPEIVRALNKKLEEAFDEIERLHLRELTAPLRATAPQDSEAKAPITQSEAKLWFDKGVAFALVECADIALAIDSGRGNEKEIAKAICALTSKGNASLSQEVKAEDIATTIARAFGSYCDLDKPDGKQYWLNNKDRHIKEARAILAKYDVMAKR